MNEFIDTDAFSESAREYIIQECDAFNKAAGEGFNISITEEPLPTTGLHSSFWIGPVLNQVRHFKKTSREVGTTMGGWWGKAILASAVEVAINNALEANTTILNVSGTCGGITRKALTDANGCIALWVMHSNTYCHIMEHSKPFYKDGDILPDRVVDVAGTCIHTGEALEVKVPILVTDNPSLLLEGGLKVIGLQKDAIKVTFSDRIPLWVETVDGLDQPSFRYQGEYDFTVQLEGFDSAADKNIKTAASSKTFDRQWYNVLEKEAGYIILEDDLT